MSFPPFHAGRRVRSEIGILQIVLDPLSPVSPQNVVVVSRKVAKLAVDRNRIKRRIRALFSTHAIPQGFQYVFYPTMMVLHMPHHSLEKAFMQLITKKA